MTMGANNDQPDSIWSHVVPFRSTVLDLQTRQEYRQSLFRVLDADFFNVHISTVSLDNPPNTPESEPDYGFAVSIGAPRNMSPDEAIKKFTGTFRSFSHNIEVEQLTRDPEPPSH